MHVSCVLKWSRTYTNENGSISTTSMHMSCVLKWSGIVIIQLVMFIYTFSWSFHEAVIFVSDNIKTTICYFQNFSVSFFHPQEHTNPTILMGAKQLVKVLLLLRPFEPYIFYNHRTIQSSHDHCKHNRHHVIDLSVPVLWTNQGQTAKRRGNPSPCYYTFLVF